VITTTTDSRKWQDWRPKRLYCHFLLIDRYCNHLDSFFKLSMVKNPRFGIAFPILVPERYISGFGSDIATSSYRLLSQSLVNNSIEVAMVENEIATLSVIIPENGRYKYFLFWQPCRYFQLSVADAIICRHFLRSLYGHKSQSCCWNFNSVFHSLYISGFGSHFRLLVVIGTKDTLFELALM